ncbi:beta strand repeat-containing protein [Candidatus Dependentiae bacterium]
MNRKLSLFFLVLLFVPTLLARKPKNKVFKNACILNALRSWAVCSSFAKVCGILELNKIKKGDGVVSWPSEVGPEGTFLGSDGDGNLVYATPSGAGNVSTAYLFGSNNALLTTDLPNGSSNVKETSVFLDGSNNISGVNSLTANTVNANLNGNATSATNFSGPLSGDVTGGQGATVVSLVGGQTAINVASATVAANAATSTNTPNTIVRRDGSGDFTANTITADLTGDVVGNLSGNATTATSATTATNFTGSLVGDVIGIQGATVVANVAGQTAANVAAATVLANNATSSNTASAIVRRDGSGNFSAGTITANLVGNVTGNLTGNADTATSATTAGTAINFSGALAGDVIGNQTTTTVALVGGQTAASVAAATVLANNATSNNTANTIVRRDASGNFTTNMITINGTVSNPNDVTTKAYVDAAASTGIVPKDPAVVVGTINVALSGTQTIDGVPLGVDDRVLLVSQNNQIENGLWLVKSLDWERPADFALGDAAQEAYVLITSGNTNAGSSWLCDTPLAVIDTNVITFVQFSLAGQTTGANVGTGDGKVFKDKTGVTLNFKSIAAGTHMSVVNNTDDVSIATDATSANTPSTIVSRDVTGTIAASLTGAASLNVLKAGDTMSGNLNMASQSQVRLQDTSGGEYVGLRAPSAVGASYTLDLPSGAPSAGQYLQALSPSATQWSIIDAPPASTKTFYVTKAGSDSNNGSFSEPFLTVKHAVSQANLVSSLSNPVAVNVGPGIFVEDNSGGPIAITSDGITICGTSLESTTIEALTISNNLFSIVVPNIEFHNLTLQSSVGSTASAISMNVSSSGKTRFDSIGIFLFQTGLDLSSSSVTPPDAFLNNIQCAENGTCFTINNFHVILLGSTLIGVESGSPANTGITVTGSDAALHVLSSAFESLETGILVTGGSHAHLIGLDLDSIENGIVVSGHAKVQLIGSSFVLNNSDTTNIYVTGAGSKIYIEGCLFDCEDADDVAQGTALKVTSEGKIIVSSSTIEEANIAIECGTAGDTSSTVIAASGVNLIKCATDIKQNALSKLSFVGGTFNSTKMVINDPTNVNGGAFDIDNNTVLTIGGLTDTPFKLYQVANGQPDMSFVGYKSDYYNHKGVVYENPNANPACQGVQSDSQDSSLYAVTGDRTKESGVNLISDAGNFGNPDNVRGWKISKQGTSGDLEFEYSNSDISGQALRGANSVMTLNGFDNQVEFPVATTSTLPTNTVAKLVWAGDTNLYRDSVGTLKTDGDVVAGGDVVIEGLTADRMVATDVGKKLITIAASPTEVGYLSGVTGPIQPQLDSKVAKAGDTMTGPLQVPSGTAGNPTIKFTGSTNTGLFAAVANKLSIGTNSVERMSVSDDEITMLARLVLTKVLCDQAIQTATASTNGSVTVGIDISVLMLNSAGAVNNYTVNFPPSPVNGQKFTILTRNTGNRNINMVSVGGTGGATVANAITRLNATDSLDAAIGGASVTYIYYQPDNAWYRCGRG